MRTVGAMLLIGLATLASHVVRAEDSLGETGVRGAGSTFAYPLLSRWSHDYRTWTAQGGEYASAGSGLDDTLPSAALEYEAIGSLAGTERVRQHAVDFAASDVPLSAAEVADASLLQFPFVIGGVVVAINIEGQGGGLRLTGPVLARIFLGNISRWSDPAIAALNPGVTLPDAAIRVVHRSDGSGTTYNFTDYLARVSPEWKAKAGSAYLIAWPTGVAAKGNEGVAKVVLSTPNAIGYVDLAQATQLKLKHAALQNRAGAFVTPSAASFQAAAVGVDWSATNAFNTSLIDQPGAQAYPLTTTVFALLYKKPWSVRSEATLDFFRWSLDHGDSTAARLGYVPLPPSLARQVENYWRAVRH
jgi:phosphate transport system substrate-binding protein